MSDEGVVRTRVLAVDNDALTVLTLGKALSLLGYEFHSCHSPLQALDYLIDLNPDIVIVDVALPGLDGFEFLRLLRARDAALAIIILSAERSIEDLVRGLEAGADDYVCKPFSISELVARMRSLLRRMRLARGEAGTMPEVIEVGELSLNSRTHQVWVDGKPMALTPTEFRILSYLMQRRGRIVSKEDLLDEIWRYDFGGNTNIVERHVSSLRKKLNVYQVSVIQTVRGFGYAIWDE